MGRASASRRWIIAIGGAVVGLGFCLTIGVAGLLIARARPSPSAQPPTGTLESVRPLGMLTPTQQGSSAPVTASTTGVETGVTAQGTQQQTPTPSPTRTLTPSPAPPSPTSTYTSSPTATLSPTPYVHLICTRLDHIAGVFVGEEFRFRRRLKNDGTAEGDGDFTFGYAENPGFYTISTIHENGMLPGVTYLATLAWIPEAAGTYDLYVVPSGAVYDSTDSCHEQVSVQAVIVISTKAP